MRSVDSFLVPAPPLARSRGLAHSLHALPTLSSCAHVTGARWGRRSCAVTRATGRTTRRTVRSTRARRATTTKTRSAGRASPSGKPVRARPPACPPALVSGVPSTLQRRARDRRHRVCCRLGSRAALLWRCSRAAGGSDGDFVLGAVRDCIDRIQKRVTASHQWSGLGALRSGVARALSVPCAAAGQGECAGAARCVHPTAPHVGV